MYTISKSCFFYPLLFICIALDMFSSFLLGYPAIQSLLCLFCVTASDNPSTFRITCLLSMLGIESFFFYGLWGAQLVYLIPLALIAPSTWDKFTKSHYHALFLLLISLFTQLIIDSLFDINIFSLFTILRFFINIVLTISLSLIYK